MSIQDALTYLLGIGAGAAKPVDLSDNRKVIVAPENFSIHDIERYLERPYRVRQTVNHRTLASLTAYLRKHKAANTAVFGDVETATLAAIVDYHSGENVPEHASHQALYKAEHSEQWKRWFQISGKMMFQGEFARFIEENQVDVVEPKGAEVLELAVSLQAKKKVNFRSATVLQNFDTDLEYTEETEAKAGVGGKITIPKQIKLGIPVFYGGHSYAIMAHLRYKIDEGVLRIGVELHRWKEVRDHAFHEILEKLGQDVEGVAIYEGSAGGRYD